MSPKDVAGVFSRLFIVGHFLPAFIALSVAALLSTDEVLIWLGLLSESGEDRSFAIQLLTIGAAALPLGLLLSNMHAHVVRIFSGEATERQMAEDALGLPSGHRGMGVLAGPLKKRLKERQESRIAKQKEKHHLWEQELTRDSRPDLQWARFDEEFPADPDKVLPTRIGNAIRAYQSYAETRYGLNGAAVWPRIEMLLSAEERSLVADARAEVAFFLNCAVCTLLVGIWVAVEIVWPKDVSWWWLLADVAVVVVLFRVLRLLAVTATFRVGVPIRTAVDLHRLDLYDRLGVRRPTSQTEERHLAGAINALLVRGAPVPNEFRAAKPSARKD